MCYNRLMNKRYWATALAIPAVFGLFATSNALADNTTVTVNVTNISLELDVPSDPAVLTLRPTATGANFGSVDLTATVGTNNPAGYQLSVEFSDTSLIRTAAIGNDTPEINTLDDLSGGYAENDFTVNRWGQKVTGDNYFPVPSGTLAPASWSSDEPVNNADNTITLAAKADGTIPSGTYEVTLTYTLVANVNPISLRQAYADAGKPTVSIGNGRYYKMQDMNPSICESVTEIPSNLQVADIRDNTIYWIGKLADGRCWLLDNLALDPTITEVQDRLTEITTNATQAAISNYINGGNPDNNNGWATEAVKQSSNFSSFYYKHPLVNTDSKNVLAAPPTTLSDLKIGVYYNYCAASIGTYCYDEHQGVDRNELSAIDVDQDVCPANWRMPTGGAISYTGTSAGGGEYQTLAEAITGKTESFSGDPDYTNFRIALRLPLSGVYDYSRPIYQNSRAYLWSSTYYSDYDGSFYILIADNNNSAYLINPQATFFRTDGLSVRCIAKTGTEPVPDN